MTGNRADSGSANVLTVQRGMQVLRAFRSDRAPLSNAELVRRTGLPKSTISRLTTTLLTQGFIRHVPGGREFELGPAPAGIGHAYIAGCELLHIANPFLQELADELDVSVALSIRDGFEMLYVGYRASHKVGTLRLGVGSLLPLGTTSIGRAYMWGLPAQEREDLLEMLRRNAGASADSLMQDIQASFNELKQTGICSVLAGFQRDAYGIALPVVVGRKNIVMSMSCGRARIQPDLAAESKLIAPVLLKAAERFQNLLADFDGEL
ncbi:IclR family transcriptional regulator [Allopusillimonas ginsengisoli]|uniref:IclR family transcriptional regulator n=1 Tax=Allopusillimonas ginsengisoli TaxID=453575 RepID=UPI0010207D33|nr:IclR family transcriptional regulator [Allopusillimonas ginsengisoli]TEA77228.1 IclR family transcriptional regulator [Allopusillimonas ginsengisoli]